MHDVAEKPLDQVQPLRTRGREMQVKSGMLRNPSEPRHLTSRKKFAQSRGQPALVAEDESRCAQRGMAATPPNEDRAPQGGEIGLGVTGAGPRFVLQPCGVTGVMVLVFNAPVHPHRPQRVGVTQRFTGHEHAPAYGADAAGFIETVAFDLDYLGGVDEADRFRRDGQGADVALIDPTVAGFELGGQKRGAGRQSESGLTTIRNRQ